METEDGRPDRPEVNAPEPDSMARKAEVYDHMREVAKAAGFASITEALVEADKARAALAKANAEGASRYREGRWPDEDARAVLADAALAQAKTEIEMIQEAARINGFSDVADCIARARQAEAALADKEKAFHAEAGRAWEQKCRADQAEAALATATEALRTALDIARTSVGPGYEAITEAARAALAKIEAGTAKHPAGHDPTNPFAPRPRSAVAPTEHPDSVRLREIRRRAIFGPALTVSDILDLTASVAPALNTLGGTNDQ